VPDLARGDRVTHATFGEGVVEAVAGDVATVRFAGGKPKTILSSHLVLERSAGETARAVDADTLFDAYIMVDWSARNEPGSGADSVWYCLLEPEANRRVIMNPRTRQQAVDEIREWLIDFIHRGRRTLLGFDFPYGFPQGTGARLGFSGGPAWRVMWDELSLLVEDRADNGNNRFAVAAELNGGMTTGPAPFWMCPPKHAGPFLQAKKPRPWPNEIPELRRTDQAVSGPKSVWQLYGAGSVGSQALMGMPRLAALRDDPAFQGVSHVWPFEDGGKTLPVPPAGAPFIVHAEVYPSLVPVSPFEAVKDAAQVRALAEHFAHLDDEGRLGALFDLSALDAASHAAVVDEEGWILGVEPESASAD
jgi:hypothetical protein